jgi:predicted nucleic acid-binding protein
LATVIDATVYVDTNVFLNVVYKESDFERSSAELLNRIQEGKIVAVTSSVTSLEIILDMDLSGFRDQTEAAVAAVEDIRCLSIVPLDQEMAKSSARHILKDRITVHDAYHLATALGSQVLYFVTRDAALSRKIKKYVKVVTPEEILKIQH